MYLDPDDMNDRLEEQYYEWLEENYSMARIEDGDCISFEAWLDDRADDCDIFNDDRLDDLDYA